MTTTEQLRSDWAGNVRSYGLAWGVPLCAMVVGLLADAPVRAAIWSLALAWMGVACIVNGRRCRRTHCRYTGPFYLAMIIPVVMIGSGAVSANIYGWAALGIFILAGSKLIWWATERAWGKFS